MKIRAEVGVAYGYPGGSWDVVHVEIDAVAEEQIERYAIDEAKKWLERQNAMVAGLWLYHHERIEEEEG